MTRCFSIEDFADLLEGGSADVEHLLRCARCWSLATALAKLDADIDLDAAVEELATRDAEAAAAVAELETALPSQWPAIAASDPRLHRPEAVRRLLARAREICDETPRRAAALTRSALTAARIAEVPPTLRVEALKDMAWCLFRIDDNMVGAEAALDEAESLIPSTDDPEFATAVLVQARAYHYGDAICARWDAALDLLDTCEPVFQARDQQRWRAARHLRAAVLLRASRYGEAAAMYAELITTESDEHALARLRSDLAGCHLRTGNAAEALRLAEEALREQSLHSRAILMAHVLFVRGEALSLLGRHDEAIAILLTVSGIFASAGMRDVELRAELAVVRAQLAGDPTAEVAARLEAAYFLACALDREQPLRSGALRAAVWSELAAAYRRKALTNGLLEHAAEYMKTIGRGDEAAFAPLQ